MVCYATAMPGHLPGPFGFAAFAGIKLAGYTVAGVTLRRLYPATRALAFTIGATRTATGLAVGIINIAFLAMFASRSNSMNGEIAPWLFLSLIVLRLIIWTFIVWLFCDRKWERTQRTLTCVVAGTAFSFLLDVAGVALALVSPGQTTFC